MKLLVSMLVPVALAGTPLPPQAAATVAISVDSRGVGMGRTLAVDDGATVHLNGTKVGEKVGWTGNAAIDIAPGLFRVGANVLAVEAVNTAGPAGLLLRLSADSAAGRTEVVSDASWLTFDAKPAEWPAAAAQGGTPASTYGRADAGAALPQPWPSLAAAPRIAGTPLPADALVSAPCAVTVTGRTLQRPPVDPERVVADGTEARYRLSWTEDSLPLRRLEPAAAEIQFRRIPRSAGGTAPP